MKDSGIYSILPYIPGFFINQINGFFCDYLIKKEFITRLHARKLFSFIGNIIPAIFLISCGYTNNSTTALTLLVIAVSFTSFGN